MINYRQPGDFVVNRADFDRALDTVASSPADQNTYNTAAYVADVINITDRFNVMASLRIDHYKDKGFHDITTNNYDSPFSQTKASPKFGAVYQIVKGQLSAFTNYQNGFSYTSVKDQSGKVFKPKQAFQTEAGLKLETASNKLSATLSYYDIAVKDKIRSNLSDRNLYVQDATQASRGLEAEFIANPVSGLNIIFGYAYNFSKYTKADSSVNGKRPYGTPKHLLNGWASYNFRQGTLKGFGLGFGGNYSSQSFADDENLITVPSYLVLSSTAFYDRGKYRIGFKVDNLTSEHYWVPFFQPQPTRSYSVNLSYRFSAH